MRKQLVLPCILSLCLFLLTSCATSPEAIGTRASISPNSTAAVWTPTLPPTKTPTLTPTVTPSVTPTPTVTPQGGSSRILIVGHNKGYTGIPSIYFYDSKTGNSNLLYANYNLAGISPDEKHLIVYVRDWKASLKGPVVGELYLTTLDRSDPILISSDFLTNGDSTWTDSDTFTFSEMKDGIIKYFKYVVSSASLNELPAPDRSNDNFDSAIGMFKTYPPGECQKHYDGTAYDWKGIVDCASQDGQYIWRELSSSKPIKGMSSSILRMDGSIVKDLTLKEVFPSSNNYSLYGFWSPNSQFLIVLGDTFLHREVGILAMADLSIEKIDLSELLPEWPPNVSVSRESFSPDGNQLLFWYNGFGPSEGVNRALIFELPTATVKTIELGLPVNTYLEKIIWLHK